jgi:proline iminopeptidase
MWAEIGDCRLHYVELRPTASVGDPRGANRPDEAEVPTLLLLHGGPGFDHTGFRPHFDRYAEDMRVVYLDQRGQGRSSRSTPDHWCLDVWADDVVRVCDVLEIRRPVVFGQSFGGMVAMRYAARHPGHARALVLSSTSAHLHLHERILPAFEAAGGTRALRAARAFFADPDPVRWAAYARHCVPLYNTTPQAGPRTELRLEVLCHFFASEAFSMDLRPGLASVTQPVLVVSGSEDPITPPEDARDIVAGLRAELGSAVRFSGAGHGVWRDRPADFFSALDRFIAEVLAR